MTSDAVNFVILIAFWLCEFLPFGYWWTQLHSVVVKDVLNAFQWIVVWTPGGSREYRDEVLIHIPGHCSSPMWFRIIFLEDKFMSNLTDSRWTGTPHQMGLLGRVFGCAYRVAVAADPSTP